MEINNCNSLAGFCVSTSMINLFKTKRQFTTGVFERKPVVKDGTIFMTPNVIITNQFSLDSDSLDAQNIEVFSKNSVLGPFFNFHAETPKKGLAMRDTAALSHFI